MHYCHPILVANVKPRDVGWRSSLVKSWKSGYMCTRKIKWYMRTRKAHMLPDWVCAYPLTVYVDNLKLARIMWYLCTIYCNWAHMFLGTCVPFSSIGSSAAPSTTNYLSTRTMGAYGSSFLQTTPRVVGTHLETVI